MILISSSTVAQRKVVISFDSTGVMSGSFPAFLMEGDVIEFNLQTTYNDGRLRDRLMKFRAMSANALKSKINRTDKYFAISTIEIGTKEKLDKSIASLLNSYHEYVLDIRIGTQQILKPIDVNTIWPAVPKNNIIIEKFIVPKGLDRDRMNFRLIHNPDSHLLFGYLKATASLYKSTAPYFNFIDKSFFSKVDSINKKIEKLKVEALLSGTDISAKVKNLMAEVKKYFTGSKAAMDRILEWNKDWLIAWSWYNNYRLEFNPFSIVKPDDQALESLQTKMTDLKKTLDLYDKECMLCKCCSDNKTDKADKKKSEEGIGQYLVEVNKQYAQGQSAIDDLNAKLKAFKADLQKFRKKSTVLYGGVLYVSTTKRIHWMRHHDASIDYEFENKKAHPTMYCEIDEVHVLTDNLRNELHTSLDENITAYEPQSVFTEAIVPALNAIKSSVSGSAPGTKVQTVTGPGLDTTLIKYKWPANFDEEVKTSSALKRLFIPVPDELLEIKADLKLDTLLKTDLTGPSKPVQGPSIVKYSLFSKTKDVRVDFVKDMQYKVYKRYSIQPYAALVYLPLDRITSVYNQTTQTFSDVSLGRYDFVAGVKYFPFLTNIELKHSDRRKYKGIDCPNIRRGNNWLLSNFSVSVGVGTQQNALKNWFFGTGFDLIKGFAVTTGINLYSKNRYDIQNGVVVSSSSAFDNTWYLGISVDPIVMAKSSGIFKPK